MCMCFCVCVLCMYNVHVYAFYECVLCMYVVHVYVSLCMCFVYVCCACMCFMNMCCICMLCRYPLKRCTTQHSGPSSVGRSR